MDSELAVEPQSLKKLNFKSQKRALDLFSTVHGYFPPPEPKSKKIVTSHKLNTEYGGIKSTCTQPSNAEGAWAMQNQIQQVFGPSSALAFPSLKDSRNSDSRNTFGPSMPVKSPSNVGFSGKSTSSERNLSTAAIMERIPSKWPRPEWHAPWKNYRVISGHQGWVRSVAVDPSNSWFCTGSADRTIKIWDLASGRLKLTLTGHIGQVRGLAVSNRHTYMFSAGDDKQVKCWDLEQNKVIRSYHGHLSSVHCLALHPTLDILFTGGNDSVCRVWDIRSKVQIHVLSGHDNAVCSVFTQPMDPQVITGSHDSTIKLWDLRNGKTMTTLTHHKKSVRAMAQHPKEDSFASASADNIKKFNLPKGEFLHNMLSQQKAIINAMAINDEGVMATGGDNGSLRVWDWRSGHNFQQAQTIAQPGSLDSEAGIYALAYDVTGTRLISCEADKTIKMWKQDHTATPETHPLHFKPPKDIRRF